MASVITETRALRFYYRDSCIMDVAALCPADGIVETETRAQTN